ncbi:MAG: hypothetical protein NC313_14480, partial [Butyrivibrio sp.]|nr:hypothetical protein [Butyrivibrio sp.]
MNKPKKNRKNYIAKPKVGKKLIMSTIASVLVLAITATLIWNAVKVSVPVEAERLSGVSEALKDHGSGEAFVILDIVAGYDENDPSGTIGYLTSGQSSLEKDLAEIFKATVIESSIDEITDYSKDLRTYEARIAKAGALGSGYAPMYEESLTGGSGWTKIYDGEKWDNDKDNFEKKYRTIIYGEIVPATNGNGAYVPLEATAATRLEAHSDAVFSYVGNATEGFEIYSMDSAVYNSGDEEKESKLKAFLRENEGRAVYLRRDNGIFEYCGRINNGMLPDVDDEDDDVPAVVAPASTTQAVPTLVDTTTLTPDPISVGTTSTDTTSTDTTSTDTPLADTTSTDMTTTPPSDASTSTTTTSTSESTSVETTSNTTTQTSNTPTSTTTTSTLESTPAAQSDNALVDDMLTGAVSLSNNGEKVVAYNVSNLGWVKFNGVDDLNLPQTQNLTDSSTTSTDTTSTDTTSTDTTSTDTTS